MSTRTRLAAIAIAASSVLVLLHLPVAHRGGAPLDLVPVARPTETAAPALPAPAVDAMDDPVAALPGAAGPPPRSTGTRLAAPTPRRRDAPGELDRALALASAPDPTVGSLALALALRIDDRATLPAIEVALRDDADPERRRRAAFLLGEVDRPEALAMAVDAAGTTTDPATATALATSLAALATHDPELAVAALRRLAAEGSLPPPARAVWLDVADALAAGLPQR